MRHGLTSVIAFMALAYPLLGAEPRATLVLRGGNVVTLDDQRPTAAAVAIQGERIVAVGSDADIAPWIGPSTEVIDCRSRLFVPGFRKVSMPGLLPGPLSAVGRRLNDQ